MPKRRNYEEEILKCLIDDVYGLTVFEIAKKIKASRNTIYRYIGKLEGKGIVFKKEVGAYNLYFSSEARQISGDIVLSYYKGLLVALSQDLPPNPARFKKYGKIIADYVHIPNEMEDCEQLLHVENPNEYVNILSSMQPYFSVLHDKIILKDIIVHQKKKEVIFHFDNSHMLRKDRASIFHFYILSGFIEAKIRKNLSKDARCNVKNYNLSENPKENFIQIALEIF
ncbi:MAG: HTH domain-containing protein [Promethearchaeota archaeon]